MKHHVGCFENELIIRASLPQGAALWNIEAQTWNAAAKKFILMHEKK